MGQSFAPGQTAGLLEPSSCACMHATDGQLLLTWSCRYKHMDMADLEAQLQAADNAGAQVKLIATGTVAGEACLECG
jgi:hypothetical protein